MFVIIRIKDTLAELMASHTGKTAEDIRKDTERNHYMDAKEALAYGIIDEILEERK